MNAHSFSRTLPERSQPPANCVSAYNGVMAGNQGNENSSSLKQAKNGLAFLIVIVEMLKEAKITKRNIEFLMPDTFIRPFFGAKQKSFFKILPAYLGENIG